MGWTTFNPTWLIVVLQHETSAKEIDRGKEEVIDLFTSIAYQAMLDLASLVEPLWKLRKWEHVTHQKTLSLPQILYLLQWTYLLYNIKGVITVAI